MRSLALFILLMSACADAPRPQTSATSAPESTPESVIPEKSLVVKTGAQVLADDGFRTFRGRRVGLITNHTARVGTGHVIDAFHRAEGVTLTALFGPEHGLRGLADAGAHIADGLDTETGVPVFSLYGERRKPQPDMLRNVDVLVFDIQDVGARFYTYISTMGLAMQAAAEAGIPFVVLDRPNPLGGAWVSGFVLKPDFASFVGQYPIPIVHGLTVGELARMIQGEKFLPGLENLNVQVVPLQGWTRQMRWPDTGLPWIKTSPNIPDFETALVYPGTCFFEGTIASEGRGTETPFKVVGAPWADGNLVAQALNTKNLLGVQFEPETFIPRSIQGMSANPKLQGERVHGIRQIITDPASYQPVETGVHILHTFYQMAPEAQKKEFFNSRFLGLLAGTDLLENMLVGEASADRIIVAWYEEVTQFRTARERYLMYQ